MVATHYRWDFIGLSTDTKPTPETSEKVVDGSTFYCSDNSKLYVWCKNQWYEKEVSGGGGTTYTAGDGIVIDDGAIAVDLVQTTGNSTKKVMSQDATTSMVYADPSTKQLVQIGKNANAGNYSNTSGRIAIGNGATSTGHMNNIAIGNGASVTSTQSQSIGIGGGTTHNSTINIGGVSYPNDGDRNILIGTSSNVDGQYRENCVCIGYGATASRSGEMNIGSGSSNYGYNNTKYRVLGGVHDPVDAHDAATKGYVDANAGGGVVTLTSADYNYPVNNPTSVAVWKLAPGIYRVGEDSLKISYVSGSTIYPYNGYEFEVEPAGDDVLIIYYEPYLIVQKTRVSDGFNRGTYGIINNLTSGSSPYATSSPLSAKQGAVLKTLIDSLIQAGDSAPTTSTVGVLGQLYTDTTNMHTYQCTAISGDTYTWTQRW